MRIVNVSTLLIDTGAADKENHPTLFHTAWFCIGLVLYFVTAMFKFELGCCYFS